MCKLGDTEHMSSGCRHVPTHMFTHMNTHVKAYVYLYKHETNTRLNFEK